MPGDKIPQSWTGRMVAVTLAVRNPDEFTGRLDEVNELGVALTLLPAGHEVATFYPWVAVRRLRLVEGGEEARTDPSRRLGGDPGWFA